MNNEDGKSTEPAGSPIERVPPESFSASNSSGKPPTPPPPPPSGIKIGVEGQQVKAQADFNAGPATGTASINFNLPSGGIAQVGLGFQQGGTSGAVSYNFDSHSFGQTFSHQFDNGLNGSITITAGPTSTSATASASFNF